MARASTALCALMQVGGSMLMLQGARPSNVQKVMQQLQLHMCMCVQDIVDAVFVCYAMDKDTHSVTKPQVHEIFSQARLPSPPLRVRPGAHMQPAKGFACSRRRVFSRAGHAC